MGHKACSDIKSIILEVYIIFWIRFQHMELIKYQLLMYEFYVLYIINAIQS